MLCLPSARRALTVVQCACLVLLIGTCHASAIAADSPPGSEDLKSGARVSDALRALSGPDLQFVFSSGLLPETLRLRSDLGSARTLSVRVKLAREILQAHGLALEPLQAGVYAVVPSPTRGGNFSSPASTPAGESSSELREIVVAASRYQTGETANATFELNRAGLNEQPGIGDDPLRALARLPGLAQDGVSAQTNIRGGETGEVLMLLDGYPLRRGFHMAGYQSLFSVLDAGIVRGVEVFTGGYPARYGNRMAGVFDFHTIDTVDAPRHSLGLDFFNASGRTAGEWSRGHVDYVASAREGTLSPLLRTFSPSVGDPQYADTFLKVGAGDPDTVRLTGNFLWARDELSIAAQERGERAEIEDRLRYLWVRADRRFTPNLSGSLWLGQSVIQSFRDGTVSAPQPATGSVLDSRASTIWDLRTAVQWQPAERHILEAGSEFTQEDAHYSYAAEARFSPALQTLFGIAPTLVREAELTQRRRRISLFAAHRWRFGDSLTTEFGLRSQGVMTSGLQSDWIIEPRFGVRWQAGVSTRLNIGWGRFHQADEVHELKVEDGLTNFPAPQRSDHFVAGIEHQLRDGLSLRAEIFNKRQTDARPRYENLLNRRTILPEIGADRVLVLPDFSDLKGLELSGEHVREEWRGWLSVSWSRASDDTAGVRTPRSWDQTWSAGGGASWQRGPWSLSAALQAHRGFPITAVTHTSTGLELGERNAARLPDFLQLDLRAQYARQLSLGELVYTFEVINTTNSANQCCTELLPDGQGLRNRSLNGLPLLPSLGLRWNW